MTPEKSILTPRPSYQGVVECRYKERMNRQLLAGLRVAQEGCDGADWILYC